MKSITAKEFIAQAHKRVMAMRKDLADYGEEQWEVTAKRCNGNNERLAKLRDEVKAQPRQLCVFCDDNRSMYQDRTWDVYIGNTPAKNIFIKYNDGATQEGLRLKLNYCPMCGRKLEED